MSVTLKGTKDGLLITLGEGEWSGVLEELSAQLDRPRAAQFFHGAHARLAVGSRRLGGSEIAALGQLLEQHAMQLDLTPPDTHSHVPVAIEAEPEPIIGEQETIGDVPEHEHESWEQAALVRRTVRSGQVIQYEGHVIVYGDVNPGAEVLAGGDVIIWGKLRGVVHAGAFGDEGAVVCALVLAPTQLRIGSQIARAPDEHGKGTRGPELARVRDGRIVIETWKAKE